MSKKNKTQKENSLSQLKNPVIVKLFLQTDDDFTVNGVFQLNQELHFATLEEMRIGIFEFFNTLTFVCDPKTDYRLNSFLGYVNGQEFKDDVNKLGTLMYAGTPFATYSEKAEVGGNQYLTVTVVSRGDTL